MVLDEIKYGEIMLDYLGGFTIISRVFISGKEEQTKRKPERWKCEKNLTWLLLLAMKLEGGENELRKVHDI